MKKKVIEINRNDIEKITYLENCNKITLYGNIYTKGEFDNKDKEQKIDSFKRDSIPLVEYNGQVVWVVGHRKFKVDFVDNAGKSSYIIIEYIQ